MNEHEPGPYRVPAVCARSAQPHEIPIGVGRIVRLAHAAGWSLQRPLYARGESMNARGEFGREVEQVTIRATRGTGFLVAVWVRGAFDFAYAATDRDAPSVRITEVRALRAFINARPVDEAVAA